MTEPTSTETETEQPKVQLCDTFCLGSREECDNAGRCVRHVAVARQDPRIIEPR